MLAAVEVFRDVGYGSQIIMRTGIPGQEILPRSLQRYRQSTPQPDVGRSSQKLGVRSRAEKVNQFFSTLYRSSVHRFVRKKVFRVVEFRIPNLIESVLSR